MSLLKVDGLNKSLLRSSVILDSAKKKAAAKKQQTPRKTAKQLTEEIVKNLQELQKLTR